MNNTRTENAFLWGLTILVIFAVGLSDPIVIEHWRLIAAVSALMALSAVISGLWYHRQGFKKGRVQGYEVGFKHGRGIF
jgi:hypothetical protein